MSNDAFPGRIPPHLLNYLFSGVVVHAPDTRIVFANEAAARLLDLSLEQLMGKPTTDAAWAFVRGDGTPMPLDEYPVNQVLATGQPLHDLVLGIHRPVTGDQVWVLVRAFPEYAAPQVLQHIVVTFIDITARKRAETALQESERRYRELVQEANSAIIRWACDGTVLFFNEYAQAFFGYRPEEIVGRSVNLLVPATESTGGDLSRLVADIVAAPEQFVNVVNENVCRDGRRVWMAWTNKPIRDNQGNVTAILAIGNDITARKQAEEALRTSQQNLETLIENTDGRIWSVDREYRLNVANQRYQRDITAALGRPMRPGDSVLVPDFPQAARDEWRSYYDRAMQHGPFSVETTTRFSAEPHIVEYRLSPITTSGGQVVGVTVFGRDITHRKQAEAALRASEARLAAFMEYAPGSVFIKDAAGRYTTVNQAFLTNSGKRADEVLGKTDAELFPELADMFVAEDVAVRREGTYRLFEETFTYHGRPYTFLSHKFPLPDGSIGSFGADITERTAAEQAFRDLQEQRLKDEQQHAAHLQELNAASLRISAASTRDEVLRLITEHARALVETRQAVTKLNTEQPWTQTDPGASGPEQHALWQGEPMPPHVAGLAALVCETNRPLRLTQAELEAHPAWRGVAVEADRHPPLRDWLAVPLVGREGRNLGLIQLSDKVGGAFTADDEALLVQLAQVAAIALENQQLYAQEQAARAQAEAASRLKDEFLSTVSHELRTPLTAVLGYAQLLQRRPRDAAYVTRMVARMVESAKAQATLIEDLLDVTRIVSGKLRIAPAPIDLIDVFHAALDTVRPMVEAKGLRLQVELDPAASVMAGDANRLQQVLWNLLANAAKFTPPGGLIVARLVPEGNLARLTVQDTGQGIPAEFLPYVFERFRQADSSSQRRHGGLGLGLAIVRHLVELHGGTVDVMSAGVGQGATFTVRLPLVDGGEAALQGAAVWEPTPAEAVLSPLRGLHILVVDDQPAILEMLVELLTAEGATVRACLTASEALALVQVWRPDVLVSDIAMPNEDGYWLIQQVRGLPPEAGGTVPAVALTAYVRMEDRLRVLAAGFQQYVPKPVDAAELWDAIRATVRDANPAR